MNEQEYKDKCAVRETLSQKDRLLVVEYELEQIDKRLDKLEPKPDVPSKPSPNV